MRTLILLLAFLTVISCSKDDNGGFPGSDIIVGTWKPVKEVDLFEGVVITTSDFSDCRQQTRYFFEENGDYSFIIYSTETGPCLETKYSEGFISGSWQKLDENRYRVCEEAIDPDDMEVLSGCNIPDKFSFPNSNTMRVHYLDDFAGDIDEYYTEFKRVN